MIGLIEKTRFIFRTSFSVDLPEIDDPIADPISHDPKKEPVISSYPPVTFIISRISKNWMEELTNPIMKRLVLISVELSFWNSGFSGKLTFSVKSFP